MDLLKREADTQNGPTEATQFFLGSVLLVEPHGPTSLLLTEMITRFAGPYRVLPLSCEEACQWLQTQEQPGQQPVIALFDCSFAHPSLDRLLLLIQAYRARAYPLRIIGMISHPLPAAWIENVVDTLLHKPLHPQTLEYSFRW